MAQNFTNFSGSGGLTSYVSGDGFVGPPATPFNPNAPAFGAVSFPSGAHGLQATATLSLPVTAVANTDLTETLPATAIVSSLTVYTTTAYTAGTSATISVGSAAGGAQYVAATTISSIGVVALTPVNAAAAALSNLPNASPNIFVRITQAGTATAVGAAKLVINYTLP